VLETALLGITKGVDLVKYDLSCDCNAEKYPLIERALGGIRSYDNNMFKAIHCEDCIKEHGDVVKVAFGISQDEYINP